MAALASHQYTVGDTLTLRLMARKKVVLVQSCVSRNTLFELYSLLYSSYTVKEEVFHYNNYVCVCVGNYSGVA